MEERISEKQLVMPAVQVISSHDEGITTAELIKELEKRMQPQGKDAEIISGRNDTHFSQKVRNLRSHKTFERHGFVEYRDNKHFITEQGKQFLEYKHEELEYINAGYFAEDDQAKANEQLLENNANVHFLPEEEISEGKLTTTAATTRTRSAKLRQYAFEHHKKSNNIDCEACDFDFKETYGEFGEDYIEFHHIKPVSIYEKDGEIINLKEAIKNLVPLCSNCHTIVHRNKMSWEALKEKLQGD
jgi:predicted HNH restriction endonuclease